VFDPDEKVSTIKDKLHAEHHVKKEGYTLKIEDRVLDFNKKIVEEGIHDGSIINVDYTVIKVTLKSDHGHKTAEVEVDPDNLVESLRTKAQEKLGINEDSDYEMKSHGHVLHTEETIHKAGIKNGDVIHIDFKQISIKVKLPGSDGGLAWINAGGEEFTITVDPDHKVKQIAHKIHQKHHEFKMKDYKLKLGEKVLDWEKTIHEEGIHADDELTMDFSNIDITIDIHGKKITINVDPDSEVATIKDKIREKENIENDVYSLKLGGHVLDETKTIVTQKIHAHSTLIVDYNVISITVKVLGEIKTLEVDPDSKVSTIKTKLHEIGIPKGEFTLVVGGQKVVETDTIAHAGIKSGTTVVVDYNDITIHYKVLGKTHDLLVDPDNEV
jgi:hypothetical protein